MLVRTEVNGLTNGKWTTKERHRIERCGFGRRSLVRHDRRWWLCKAAIGLTPIKLDVTSVTAIPCIVEAVHSDAIDCALCGSKGNGAGNDLSGYNIIITFNQTQ